ncbi:MAG: FAD binding domain-containing protein [Anaerolineaceae bacterium]|nr:FAD binding domain-containing protein [Anaerolineaceae bacterium]
MILEYHRPKTMDAALDLLMRAAPRTLPLAGGSVLSRPGKDEYAVVDLQELGLDSIQVQGNVMVVGAATSLQRLMDFSQTIPALRDAIHQEVSFNLRQVGSIAGTLVTADGRSPFTTVLMALDARLSWLPENIETGIGDWLPFRNEGLPGRLMVQVAIPLQVSMAFQYVARTLDDRPIVCAAVTRWPSKRTRIVLGGYGTAPLMAMDGTESTGAELAARNAYSQADDAWATAEYRQHVAPILVKRCLMELEQI